eukprot:64430_1
MDSLCWEFSQRLFWNKEILFSLSNIVYILDRLSQSIFAPPELNGMPMGQAILHTLTKKNTLKTLGTKGTAFIQQQKEVMITSGLTVTKKSGKTVIDPKQRKLINNIIPHINKNEKASYCDKLASIRAEFDETVQTNAFTDEMTMKVSLCDDYKPRTREIWSVNLINNMIETCTVKNRSPSPSKRDTRRKKK